MAVFATGRKCSLFPGLMADERIRHLPKEYYSAFQGPTWKNSAWGKIGRIAICGVMTHLCVDTTPGTHSCWGFNRLSLRRVLLQDASYHMAALTAPAGFAEITTTDGSGREVVKSFFDLIIVGGGPAGLAACIQASHMGLKILILEKDAWGGRLRLAKKWKISPVCSSVQRRTGGQRLWSKPAVRIVNGGGGMRLDRLSEACVCRHVRLKHVQRQDSNCGYRRSTKENDHSRARSASEASFLFVAGPTQEKGRQGGYCRGAGKQLSIRLAVWLKEGRVSFILIRGGKPRAFEGLVQEAKAWVLTSSSTRRSNSWKRKPGA